MNMENSKCDHLKTVISKEIKEQYTESLPVFDDESEILFYYKTIEKNGILFLEGIYHIFLIDRVTGEVEEILASDIISDETAQSIRFSPVFIQYQPEKEHELKERYYSLYDRMLAISMDEIPEDEEIEIMESFKQVFESIVPVSMLKEVYLSLGNTLFHFIWGWCGGFEV